MKKLRLIEIFSIYLDYLQHVQQVTEDMSYFENGIEIDDGENYETIIINFLNLNNFGQTKLIISIIIRLKPTFK